MKLKFLGASGVVTGSANLLTSDSGQSVLVDFGLFQGSEELEKLNFVVPDIDYQSLSACFLTHAHLDHCGRLPLLVKNGFNKNIYMTPPTRDMVEISLLDAAKIMKLDLTRLPIYDKKDVEDTMNLIKTVEYEEKFRLGDFEVIFNDDGHILGSASIELMASKKVVFSGDLGNTPQPLVQITEKIHSGDVVVIESTYGDKDHIKEDAPAMIQKEINEIEKTGGTLLIPAFSIERSQELLHIISHLKKQNKVKKETIVYFDSPMAQKVTEVYENYKDYFNMELVEDFRSSNPFHFEGAVFINKWEESENVVNQVGAKVIIAGSGMMTGGRILKHAANFLPEKDTRILFVGYQGEGTLGREILEGSKEVDIDGETIEVKATISNIESLSSHADQTKLLEWLGNIKGVKEVFITHGDEMQRKALEEKIKSELNISKTTLPLMNQEFELLP